MTQTLMQQYGSARGLLAAFAPERQAALTADREEAFLGSAPTLWAVAQTWGDETARLWVATQVEDLARFAGGSKMTMQQIACTAEVITAMHGRLKLTELMYFFLHLKGGEWGNYYGLGNGLQVTSALNQFLSARIRIIDQLERDRQAREQQAQQQAAQSRGNSYERYLEWRRSMGMGEPQLPWLTEASKPGIGTRGAGKGGAR